jgi:uncharacterized YigZ family protein
MSDPHFYNTIERPAVAEVKERGSRFIAYAYPVTTVEAVKKQIESLKKEHPKANHHCFAYRLGLDNNVFRVSDDGEPSGTAGKPILGQIDSKQLTDTLIIVVRYFGGTLLGVPGLIHAYKSAAVMALQLTPIVHRAIEVNYQLHFDYTRMNEVMMVVKQMNCTVLSQEMNLFCVLNIGVPKSKLDETLYRLGDLHTVEVKKISQ